MGVAPVYLLSGDEFLAEEALAGIRAAVGGDALSEVRLDPSADAAELVGALQTPSLLGGTRLVVVTSAHRLTRAHTEALRSYLASPAPSSVLVLVAEGRTGLEAAVRAAGEVVTLERPRGRALPQWVRRRARTHGLQLDEAAARALVDAVGPELRDLDGALAQLATSLGREAKVGQGAVARTFVRRSDQPMYALTDAVGDRRLGAALAALRALLDQGEPALVVLAALSGHVRRMIEALDAGTPRAAAERLGMPEWRAERLLRQARAWRPEELVAALRRLAEADVEIKGDAPLPEAALERAVVCAVGGGAA